MIPENFRVANTLTVSSGNLVIESGQLLIGATAINTTSLSDSANAAYTNAIAFAANADNISSGTVDVERLGSGTANTLTWLRGDGSWQIGPLGYTGSAGTNGYTGSQGDTGYTGSGYGTDASVQMGSLGVGTAASGTTGEIRATNNITAYYSSDAKFKKNVHPINNALMKVCLIGGMTFDWTDDYIAEHGGEDGYFVRKSDFGVIAQDVQSVFPLAVRTRKDGTLAVDYEKLCALAFAAIKELHAQVEELKNKTNNNGDIL